MRRFEIHYADDRVLSISMTLDPQLVAVRYRVHLSRGGVLLWRLDRHRGHETAHGGPTRIHVLSETDRRPYPPVTLADVADGLHHEVG